METRKPHSNRTLLIVLVALYLLSLGAFLYANWRADPQGTQWWMHLLNIPILSIPLVLLYGGIYVLASAWRERKALGQVSLRLARVIRWAPRIAGILIIFFISLFSLDVLEMPGSFLEKLGGFLMHNIPSIAMIALLAISWKRPVVGFVAFLVVGLLFTAFFVRGFYAVGNLLLFVFPILLVAGLFYADWKWLEPQISAQAGPEEIP